MSLAEALPWLGLAALPLLAAIARALIEREATRMSPVLPWQALAWDASRDAILCSLRFLLLGPPIGAAVLWLVMLATDGVGAIGSAWKAGLMMLGLGWLFGGVQALVAGAVAGLLRPLGGSVPAYAAVTVSGLLACGCMAFVFGFTEGARALERVALLLLLPALVAGPVCMWTLHRDRDRARAC